MKLKFYASFIFLFFVCAAVEGQYSIWKPVTPYALTSSQNFIHKTRITAASDSNSIHFLIFQDGWNNFYSVKSDKNNHTTVDSTYLSNTPFYDWSGGTGKAIVFNSEIYLYNNSTSYKSVDTVDNTLYKMDTNMNFTPIINYQITTPSIQPPPIISDAIVYKNELYVIGGMNAIETIVCNGIAKYNGANWTTLGTGIDNGLPKNVLNYLSYSFKIFDDKLYIIAQNMDTISGNPLSNFISCWDGSKWLFKKILSDTIPLFSTFCIMNNKLYGVVATNPMECYEISDSVILAPPFLFDCVDVWNISNINNQIWVQSGAGSDLFIVDTNTISTANQYNLYTTTTVPNEFIAFDNKIYTYGLFEALNMRFVAQTDLKPIKVSGQVIYDRDSNCQYNGGDLYAANSLIKITPGPVYSNTDSLGKFNFIVAGDTIIVQPNDNGNFKTTSCSIDKYTLYTTDTTNYGSLNFSIGIVKSVHDLSVKTDGYTGWRARRGFTESYVVHVKNEGTEKDLGKVRIYYSDKFEIKNTNPKADSITTTWAEWTVPSLDLFEEYNLHLSGRIDTSLQNGDTLMITSQINLANDYNKSGNVDTLSQLIVSSFDPNVIVAFPQGNDSTNIVFPTHKQLEYLIHFQNDGTDTAYNISVIDTLNENLDVSKFEIISSSHKMYYKILPYDQQVNKHFIKFSFDNILLAPTDTTQTNQTDNGGFVSYKIHLKNNLPIGTEIPNRAYIYFDYNSAVETNTAIVRIDTTIANGISHTGNYNNTEAIYYWPVPSSDKLFILNLLNEKQQIEIYNIEGKKLMTHSLNANETSSINLEQLPSGMYFLRSLSGEPKVYKFIKN